MRSGTSDNKSTFLDQCDPDLLERDLPIVMMRYQRNRCPSMAQLVLRYLEALIHHQELDGGDEQRCRYMRLIRQWQYLSQQPGLVEGGLR